MPTLPNLKPQTKTFKFAKALSTDWKEMKHRERRTYKPPKRQFRHVDIQ